VSQYLLEQLTMHTGKVFFLTLLTVTVALKNRLPPRFFPQTMMRGIHKGTVLSYKHATLLVAIEQVPFKEAWDETNAILKPFADYFVETEHLLMATPFDEIERCSKYETTAQCKNLFGISPEDCVKKATLLEESCKTNDSGDNDLEEPKERIKRNISNVTGDEDKTYSGGHMLNDLAHGGAILMHELTSRVLPAILLEAKELERVRGELALAQQTTMQTASTKTTTVDSKTTVSTPKTTTPIAKTRTTTAAPKTTVSTPKTTTQIASTRTTTTDPKTTGITPTTTTYIASTGTSTKSSSTRVPPTTQILSTSSETTAPPTTMANPSTVQMATTIRITSKAPTTPETKCWNCNIATSKQRDRRAASVWCSNLFTRIIYNALGNDCGSGAGREMIATLEEAKETFKSEASGIRINGAINMVMSEEIHQIREALANKTDAMTTVAKQLFQDTNELQSFVKAQSRVNTHLYHELLRMALTQRLADIQRLATTRPLSINDLPRKLRQRLKEKFKQTITNDVNNIAYRTLFTEAVPILNNIDFVFEAGQNSLDVILAVDVPIIEERCEIFKLVPVSMLINLSCISAAHRRNTLLRLWGPAIPAKRGNYPRMRSDS
jgi:hypothetical protein